MSRQQPSGSDTGRQPRPGIFNRPHEHYRPFHHPFTTSQPVHVPNQEQQSNQFPIFLDRRPPNRLEALVLGKAAQKLKRYHGNNPEPPEKEETVPVNPTPNKEDKRQERGSAVSLKLLSPRLHAEAKSDFELPPQPIRSGVALRLRYLFTKFVIEWWLLELISWIFSAICMTTIIAVLWYFDGKELPQLKLGITLNGFISVFSNLARASLILPTAEALGQLKWNWFRKESKTMMDFEILDSASRGPWGAFLLLLRTRGRTMASIGAAVIILALPLELFFQQVVLYPSVWVSVTPLPPIARTTTYTPLNPIAYNDNIPGLVVDPYLNSVALPFFYSNPALPDVHFSCPTTNCSWNSFDTLGVCSSCSENISNLLDFGCYTAPADWYENVTLAYNATNYPNVSACGYWLNASSESRVLMTGYSLNSTTNTLDQALGMRIFPLVDSFTRQPYYGGSVNFKDVVNPLLDVLIVGTPGDVPDINANATPVGYECVLYWCTQRLESSFWWGHINENVMGTFKNTTNTGYPWETRLDPNGNPQYAYLSNITITPPNQPDSHGIENLTFEISNVDAEVTILLLDGLAPSFLTIDPSTSQPLFKYQNHNTGSAPKSRELTNNPWLPPNNASQQMANLATALTTGIRNTQNSNGSFETVDGAASDTAIHVQIRWPWIVLPLLLLILGLIFLLSTVVRSSREVDDVGIWKTSALAILFNGLGEDVQRSVGPGCKMGDARVKARELMVKLLPD